MKLAIKAIFGLLTLCVVVVGAVVALPFYLIFSALAALFRH